MNVGGYLLPALGLTRPTRPHSQKANAHLFSRSSQRFLLKVINSPRWWFTVESWD